jgi:hypothetical protein
MTWQPEGRRGGQIFAGLVFVTIGAVLLLANLKFLNLRPVLADWWPLILVAVGIKHLFLWRGTAGWISGAFWISAGGLFLASRLGYLQVSITSILWPLMVIWFGILVAWGPCGPCGTSSVHDGSKT